MSKANNPVIIDEAPELEVGDIIEHRRYGGYAPSETPYRFTITAFVENGFNGVPSYEYAVYDKCSGKIEKRTTFLESLKISLRNGQFVKLDWKK